MKKLALVIIFVAIGAGIAWRLLNPAQGNGRGGKPDKSAAVTVVAAPIRTGTIRDARLFTGTLQPRARYVIAPKIAGRVETLSVNIGDAVAPEQAIATLDDEEYVQNVAQARAALAVAEATVEQQSTARTLAEREMQRARTLRDKLIASEAEWDTAEAEFKAKEAQYKVAIAQRDEKKSALKAAEVRLSYARIIMPTDPEKGNWFVEDRFVDVGAMLAANTPIVSVVDLASVTAVINVIERDYPTMKPGLAVSIITDAFPNDIFSGTITRVAPALKEASRQARVEIEIPNTRHLLRPGMFIRAEIEFARHDGARIVPRAALVKQNGQDHIFRLDAAGAKALKTPVVTGILTAEDAEVLEPTVDGMVITLGQHLVSDGAAVAVARENAAAPEDNVRPENKREPAGNPAAKADSVPGQTPEGKKSQEAPGAPHP